MWLAAAACPKQCLCECRAAGRVHTSYASASQVPPLGGAACGAKRNPSKSATDMHRCKAQTPCAGSLCDCITCEAKLLNRLQHTNAVAILNSERGLSSARAQLSAHATWRRTTAVPVAAWTSTRVPGCTCAASCRHASAVRNTVGTAAASAPASAGGHGQTIRASTCTVAPRLPVAWPYTQSPILATGSQLAATELSVQHKRGSALGKGCASSSG